MFVSRNLLILLFSLIFQLSSFTLFAKDFSQFDMMNANSPSENIVTAGQPSINDLKQLAKQGTKIVINLRTEHEFSEFDEKDVVEKLGMKYVSLPIAGMNGITVDNAQRLHFVLSDKKPVFIHCASSNRVGGLLALREFKFNNKNIKESLQLGKNAGMKSTEKRVKSLIGL